MRSTRRRRKRFLTSALRPSNMLTSTIVSSSLRSAGAMRSPRSSGTNRWNRFPAGSSSASTAAEWIASDSAPTRGRRAESTPYTTI